MKIKKIKQIKDISLEDVYRRLSKAGAKVIYPVLLLVYAYRRKETPTWAKTVILGALSYFVSPIDMIPDLTPLLGYTDDLSVIVAGISSIAMYINDDVRKQAKDKLRSWLPDYDLGEIEIIDTKMH